MTKLLPPTIGGRLAKCGSHVLVFGTMPGAEVDLKINNSIVDTETANGTAFTFSLVNKLIAGDKVSAMQSLGSEKSEWSNEVLVEDVLLPLNSPLTDVIPQCASCLSAWGVAPGSKVELEQDGDIIGDNIINRFGNACIGLKKRPKNGLLSRTITCAVKSNDSKVKVKGSVKPPRPSIGKPIFECQTYATIINIVPGAIVEVFVSDGSTEKLVNSFCSCWGGVNARLGRGLKPGESVTAHQIMGIHEWDCDATPSDKAVPVPAEKPDHRIKPQILKPVTEGDSLIHVINQIEGGTITLLSRPDAHGQEEELGKRPSSENPEIPVNHLKDGQILRVMQELCNVQEFSDPVTVGSGPAVIDPPVVQEPLYACGGILTVKKVIPGANVHVLQSEPGFPDPQYPLGTKWSNETSIDIYLFPTLAENAYVAAYQEIGGKTSDISGRVLVNPVPGLPQPQIVPPVVIGGKFVFVTDIVHGAYVCIFDKDVQIGGISVTGVQASIPTYWPIQDDAKITAKQMFCQEESEPSQPEKPVSEEECPSAPDYKPDLWTGNNSKKQCCNNCYNYACDIRTDNFAQPGYASGIEMERYELSCDTVTKAALSDGLKKCKDSCHPCHHKVALVLIPGDDYHWYRQDKNGLWSHKRGQSPVKNVDTSHNLIYNPETADISPYTVFCGYFCVYKPDISIGGPGCIVPEKSSWGCNDVKY